MGEPCNPIHDWGLYGLITFLFITLCRTKAHFSLKFWDITQNESTKNIELKWSLCCHGNHFKFFLHFSPKLALGE